MIHVVDKGVIIESGTHIQLLAQGGAYYHLVAAQMGAGAAAAAIAAAAAKSGATSTATTAPPAAATTTIATFGNEAQHIASPSSLLYVGNQSPSSGQQWLESEV